MAGGRSPLIIHHIRIEFHATQYQYQYPPSLPPQAQVHMTPGNGKKDLLFAEVEYNGMEWGISAKLVLLW